MVLNSHTLPLKARHFRLERLLKELGSLWWQVKRFVETEWGMEKNRTQQLGFSFFKSFSLKTFIAFVTLFRKTVTSITEGYSGPEDWEEAESQKQSVSGDSHDLIGWFSY